MIRRKYLMILLVVCTLLSAGVARAEESSRDFLAKLVGTWEVAGTAAGKPLSGRFEFNETETDDCLVSTYSLKLGEDNLTGRHITGWDSATDTIRTLGFFSSGVMEHVRYKRVSPNVGKGAYSGSKDGEKFEAEITVTFSEDGTTVKFETDGMMRAGKPAPGLSVTFTRTPADEQVENAFHAYGNHMVGGAWSPNREEAAAQTQHAYRWGPGGRFLLFTENSSDGSRAFAVIGIDPASGKWTWWTFRSDGSVSTIRISEKQIGPNDYAGRLTGADGKPSGTYAARWIGRDRFEITADAQIDGRPLPKKEVWERDGAGAPADLTSAAPGEVPRALNVFAAMGPDGHMHGQFVDGMRFRGVTSTSWILGGRFQRHSWALLTGDQASGGYLSIVGIDPLTGKATGWQWTSDGGVSKFILTPDGRSLAGTYHDGVGKRMQFEGKFTVEQNGTIKYTAKGKFEDEEPKAYEFTFEK